MSLYHHETHTCELIYLIAALVAASYYRQRTRFNFTTGYRTTRPVYRLKKKQNKTNRNKSLQTSFGENRITANAASNYLLINGAICESARAVLGKVSLKIAVCVGWLVL